MDRTGRTYYADIAGLRLLVPGSVTKSTLQIDSLRHWPCLPRLVIHIGVPLSTSGVPVSEIEREKRSQYVETKNSFTFYLFSVFYKNLYEKVMEHILLEVWVLFRKLFIKVQHANRGFLFFLYSVRIIYYKNSCTKRNATGRIK